MTITHKTKSKVPKVFNKYGFNLCVKNEDGREIAKFGFLSNFQFKRNIKSYVFLDWSVTDIEQLFFANLCIAKIK